MESAVLSSLRTAKSPFCMATTSADLTKSSPSIAHISFATVTLTFRELHALARRWCLIRSGLSSQPAFDRGCRIAAHLFYDRGADYNLRTCYIRSIWSIACATALPSRIVR